MSDDETTDRMWYCFWFICDIKKTAEAIDRIDVFVKAKAKKHNIEITHPEIKTITVGSGKNKRNKINYYIDIVPPEDDRFFTDVETGIPSEYPWIEQRGQ